MKAKAPTSAPFVVASLDVPDLIEPGGYRQGGRLLRVCGFDRTGVPYTSELLVFWSGPTLISKEPVFWSGLTIGAGATPVAAPRSGGAPVPSRCAVS